MKASLHRIGNSQGIILPKPLLAQLDLDNGELELTVERDAIVLRKPKKAVRAGWAAHAKKIADESDDALVWPEFENDDDATLTW